ncbi:MULTISPECIES: hypothetical protein [Romboutsia]|jgi:5,10-methylenetetrahydrofolate reductase|uniref:hypothetical protein n=1 Tax=Romboutsia TaxID=1501226 RepID=UPI002173D010|nr:MULTISPECIES: hypothetical protein [Romboutsia]MCI9061675.1 zinc ABC transporter substrate-binding protein [Romboutsia sp.]MCI9260818.1 zinc ABC transporter substrate-binding protein [Romboutsia sp.]
MSKRRTIYKGFNKRRKNRIIKIYIIGASICLICGYGFMQFKNSKIFNSIKENVASIELRLPFFNSKKSDNNRLETFEYNDISKEIDEIKKENDEVNEDVKVATVKGWNVYTIQVASVEDKNEISEIEAVLSKEKVPFSTIEIDGVNKVQTYVSFDKESIRNYLESIRTLYPDAFLAEVKMPVLSLEYTSKYSYLETISEQLSSLIDNFELESKLWTNSKDNLNLKEYNTILTNRKTMVENIEKEVEQIDYEGADVFKSNLITYLNNVDRNIEEASKSANEQKYNISEGIFLNSLQGYLAFINSI